MHSKMAASGPKLQDPSAWFLKSEKEFHLCFQPKHGPTPLGPVWIPAAFISEGALFLGVGGSRGLQYETAPPWAEQAMNTPSTLVI